MADNYLEKQMEDYRNGRLRHQYRKQTTPSGATAGVVSFPLPIKTTLIVVTDLPLRNALIEQFVAVGCRTAFIGSDCKADSLHSQRTGSLFIPTPADAPLDTIAIAHAADIARSRWGTLELIITLSSSSSQSPCPSIPQSPCPSSPQSQGHVLELSGDINANVWFTNATPADTIARAALLATLLPDSDITLK